MKGICTDNPGIENLIVNNGVYVDKTDVLLELIRDPLASQFFLSRPRRFGKSLMIDTLLEIFKGRRELFKDTFIGRSDRLQRRFASGMAGRLQLQSRDTQPGQTGN